VLGKLLVNVLFPKLYVADASDYRSSSRITRCNIDFAVEIACKRGTNFVMNIAHLSHLQEISLDAVSKSSQNAPLELR
jgi:hypothetical protein